MKNASLHKGHRQRLKDKVRNNGIKSLSKHEQLELLLTYTIPYKDTNELAHRLLNEYGSLYNLLNAPKEDLMNNDGVGEETALFFRLLPEYFELYCEEKDFSRPKINTISRCVNYFREKYEITDKECSYIVLTNNKDEVIKNIELSNGDSYKTSFDMDKLSHTIVGAKAKNIVMFHTHPNGNVNPSVEDINATKTIVGICKLLGVKLLDHIILNKCEYYSFRDGNILMELEIEIDKHLKTLYKNK